MARFQGIVIRFVEFNYRKTFHPVGSFSILNEFMLFVFDCSFSLWYNLLDHRLAMKQET